eukprot:2300483-Amphidinium_carterae.1
MSANVTSAHQAFSYPADLTPFCHGTDKPHHARLPTFESMFLWDYLRQGRPSRLRSASHHAQPASSQSRHHRPLHRRYSVQTYAWEQV